MSALKKLLCASFIGALGAVAAPAHAAVITFDGAQNIVTAALNAGDTDYNTGDAFTEAGFTLRVNNNPTAEPDEYGLVGAMIDSSDSVPCLIASCPIGNGSVYFAGLNDGWLSISHSSGLGFRVGGLHYGFIAPIWIPGDVSYGRLILTGTTASGATISTGGDFPGRDMYGRRTFDQFLLDPAFGNTTLASLTIHACLFLADDCVSARDLVLNQAQFAIDDLNLTAVSVPVPEPASVALMLLGMVGLTSVSRRRAR